MRRLRETQRAAFTLLEMMLALVIGVMLMSALYFALDMHMTGASAGRIQIEQSQVARYVVKNIAGDIQCHLATLDAYPVPAAAAAKAANATTTTTPTGPFPFNMGVEGQSDRLTLYVSKVPKAAAEPADPNALPGNGADVQADESDLRRVTYWLVPNHDGTGGLARQEVRWVTSEDRLEELPPDVGDEQSMIFAKTVIDVSFEYYDGVQWLTEWDGTEVLSDMVTPRGPPLAIAVKVSVARPDNVAVGPDDPGVKTFRHIIHVSTASFHELDQNPTTGKRP